VDVEAYPRGTTDFGSNLSSLREILLKEQKGEMDPSFLVDDDGDPLPEDAIPVSLDGLFVPGHTEEVISIAPQVRFRKIETTVLGTDGWGEKKVLDLAKDYVEGVVFASGFSHLDYDSSFREFEEAYQKKYQIDLNNPAILGYQAAILLRSVISDEHDPQRIRKRLSFIKGSDQPFSVNFDSGGANNLFYIYIIQNGMFRKVK